MMWKRLSFVRKPLVVAIASATTVLAAASPAMAMNIDFGDESELSGSFDVTLGYATSYRTEDADTSHDSYNE